MQKIVKTVIDKIPVTFELISIGPATPEQLANFEQNINKELQSQLSIETNDGKLQVIQVGDGNVPATPEELEKVRNAIKSGNINAQELMDRLNQIEQVLNNPDGKPWWTSRTIITNVIFIAVAIAAVFGFNIPISEDIITIVCLLVSVVNIWLRKRSKSRPISNKLIPRET